MSSIRSRAYFLLISLLLGVEGANEIARESCNLGEDTFELGVNGRFFRILAATGLFLPYLRNSDFGVPLLGTFGLYLTSIFKSSDASNLSLSGCYLSFVF